MSGDVTAMPRGYARGLARLWSLLVAGVLLTALALGFLASQGAVDRNVHGMVAFVAAAVATGSHIRRGGGWDFLAVVALGAAVGLGLMVQGGGAAGDVHLVAALLAAVLSAGLHVARVAGDEREPSR